TAASRSVPRSTTPETARRRPRPRLPRRACPLHRDPRPRPRRPRPRRGRAAERWPHDGVPANPGAWIVATAKNSAIDRIRRAQTLARKTELLARAVEVPETETSTIPDERLELVFACCHPALAADAQVALTLSLVGGLATPEIARAFLVPEATLAQRL